MIHAQPESEPRQARAWWPFADLSPADAVLGLTLVLLVTGLTMVYSASAVFAAGKYHDDAYFFIRQLKYAALGLAAMATLAHVPLATVRRLLPWIVLIGLVALVAVLIPGIGRVSNGARRWLPLGIALIQPAELAKLLVIVFMANVVARRIEKDREDNMRSLWLAAGWAQLIALLVLLEKDLGTAVVIEGIVAIMLFLGGVKLGPLLVALVAATPIAAALIYFEPYRVARVLSFLDPFAQRRGAGYQLSEALISLGSGGATGLGLGDGKQKLYFLPEAHTDFIFAIIGEELGFIGVIGLVALFALYLALALKIARDSRDVFSRFVVLGVATWVSMQAGVNMCVATGLLPTKGLTLPFISYGGSSLVACCIGSGLLYSVARSNALRTRGAA